MLRGSGPALCAPGRWRGASRSPLAPFPVVEPGVDGNGDPDQRDGNQHPAQRVEVADRCVKSAMLVAAEGFRWMGAKA